MRLQGPIRKSVLTAVGNPGVRNRGSGRSGIEIEEYGKAVTGVMGNLD